MKANFMIGDWVEYRFTGWTEKDGVYKDYQYVQISSIGQLYIKADNDRVASADGEEFYPIPLTSEILEKNGFVKANDGWECDENDVVSIVLHSEKSCDMWIAEASYEWKHLRYVLPYPKCVHELQHALRLCGIDKEIEL